MLRVAAQWTPPRTPPALKLARSLREYLSGIGWNGNPAMTRRAPSGSIESGGTAGPTSGCVDANHRRNRDLSAVQDRLSSRKTLGESHRKTAMNTDAKAMATSG